MNCDGASDEKRVEEPTGGLPRRLTFDGSTTTVAGWTPDARILARSKSESTLPEDQLSAIDLGTGDRLVLTARGQVFVAPAKQGRFVEIPRAYDVRHRNVRFLPDGKSLVSLSDATGELELLIEFPLAKKSVGTLLRDNGVRP